MFCMWILPRFSLAFLILALLAMPARSASLSILAPPAALPGLKVLAAQYSANRNIPVTVGGANRATILARLKTGEVDLVILPTSDLIETNLVHGMTPLGRVPIGLGVRAGSRVPDISTPEKFRAVLLRARGVAYPDPSTSPSGQTIANMLAMPDLRAVKRVPVPAPATAALADGRADMVLELVPSLANDSNVKVAGPIPLIYGGDMDFSAGIAARSINAVAARDFINFITSPQGAKMWQANGLTPLFR